MAQPLKKREAEMFMDEHTAQLQATVGYIRSDVREVKSDVQRLDANYQRLEQKIDRLRRPLIGGGELCYVGLMLLYLFIFLVLIFAHPPHRKRAAESDRTTVIEPAPPDPE